MITDVGHTVGHGLTRYSASEASRIIGCKSHEIEDVLGQTTFDTLPGQLVFKLEGKTCRVSATGEPGDALFLVFADPTNGESTYPAGRFLVIAPPDSNGLYTVDFNRAYNPPCCFTPYATCPLPPPENRLPVPVTAGEKTWSSGH